MATIIASYLSSGNTTLRHIYGENKRCCQTFKLYAGITSANALYIQHGIAYRLGTLGNITIAIYAVNINGEPTGNALGTVTIASTYWNQIPGMKAPMQGAGVTFDDCTLQSDTIYALVISAVDGDSNNEIRWYTNDTGYADGEALASNDGGSSWIHVGGDFNFRIYGDILPGKAQNPTPADGAGDVPITGIHALKYLQWEAPD